MHNKIIAALACVVVVLTVAFAYQIGRHNNKTNNVSSNTPVAYGSKALVGKWESDLRPGDNAAIGYVFKDDGTGFLYAVPANEVSLESRPYGDVETFNWYTTDHRLALTNLKTSHAELNGMLSSTRSEYTTGLAPDGKSFVQEGDPGNYIRDSVFRRK